MPLTLFEFAHADHSADDLLATLQGISTPPSNFAEDVRAAFSNTKNLTQQQLQIALEYLDSGVRRSKGSIEDESAYRRAAKYIQEMIDSPPRA